MKGITCTAGLMTLFIMNSAIAEPPVTISGPSPAIASFLNIGTTNSYTYTITNNVPHASFPLSIEGLLSPVSRTSVSNDCGSSLPAGPSSCHIGITIAPTLSNSGQMINQTLSANYQGRVPLKQAISFSVPPVLASAGTYLDGSSDTVPAFASSINNGSTWSQQVLSLPSGYTGSVPQGISCVGSACVAVGYADNGEVAAEVYRSTDYGVTWSNDQVQRLSGVTSSQLHGVSCLGSICNAVGYGAQSGAIASYFARSTNAGESWTQQTLAPVVSGSIPDLKGVSCSGNSCVGVGYILTADFSAQNPFTVSSNDAGLTWTQQSLPIPTDNATTAELNGVSCNGSQCVGVGNYTDADTANDHMIVETTQNGGASWSAQVLAYPTGYTNADLNAISWYNNRYVAVGGASSTGLYATNPLISISTDNGSSWTTQVLTLPTGFQTAVLYGVTCSAASCAAVGLYRDNSGDFFQGVAISTDQGATWTQQVLTPPAGYTTGHSYAVS